MRIYYNINQTTKNKVEWDRYLLLDILLYFIGLIVLAFLKDPIPHLRFCELELLGKCCSLGHRKILSPLELGFQGFDLGCRKGGSRALLSVIPKACNGIKWGIEISKKRESK